MMPARTLVICQTSIARVSFHQTGLYYSGGWWLALLDALLLEQVKREVELMPAHLPTAFEDVRNRKLCI